MKYKVYIIDQGSVHQVVGMLWNQWGPGETVETFFRQRMASCFASNLLPLHENQEENIHLSITTGHYTVN